MIQPFSYLSNACRSVRTRLNTFLRVSAYVATGARSRKADAAYQRGRGYLYGDGLPHDPTMAVVWLMQAAERGHAPAQHILSMIYLTGVRGWAAAGIWLDEASHGTEAAMANANLLYPQGLAVTPDANAAFAWAKAAAQHGLAHAEANLGMLYARGIGCDIDFAQAAHWYKRAAAKGDPAGALGLGILCENGLGVPKDTSEAARWYLMSASQDNDVAATALGLLHLSGLLTDSNPTEAARLLAGPAARGNLTAQYRLGLLYLEGQGLTRSQTRARAWLSEAARRGHKEATIALQQIALTEHEGESATLGTSALPV